MNRTGFKVTIILALAVVVLASQATGGPPKSEVAEQMQERMLQRADTNRDGAIDKEEAKRFAEQMGQGRGGR